MNNSELVDDGPPTGPQLGDIGDVTSAVQEDLPTEPHATPPQDAPPQAPVEPNNGPFFKKLAVVGFVAVVLLGVVTADQMVKRFWGGDTEAGPAGHLVVDDDMHDDMHFAVHTAANLSPEDKYKLKLLKEQQQEHQVLKDVDLPSIEPVYDPEAEEIRKLEQLQHKESPFKLVFKFMGSETGAFAKVIARRLFELVNLAMLVAMVVLLIRIATNPDMTTGAVPAFDAPFTGLSILEKVVYGGMAALAAYQCFRAIYSPSWMAYIPNGIVKIVARIRSTLVHIQDNLGVILSALNPKNWSSSLSLTIDHAWQHSYVRQAFRRVFPEGTWKSVSKYLRTNYAHLVYAPFWLGLLLAFHMLYLYDPTALVGMVERLVPWVVPDTIVSGLVTPIAAYAGSFAASQPMFATLGTWLFVSFGIGSLVRPWSYKRRDQTEVDPADYYKPNKFAKVLHIVAGLVCFGLLLLFYVPSVRNLVQYLTEQPLETAMVTAYTSVRAVLWVALQTASSSFKWIVSTLYSLQWPSNVGYLPLAFTMAWGSISVFALYAIPKIVHRIMERKKVWRMCPGNTDSEKKDWLKKAEKIALSIYLVVCIAICLPVVLNIVLQGLNVLFGSWMSFTIPVIQNIPVFSWVTSNVFVMFPFLLVPPFVFLFAVQFNWFIPYKTFRHSKTEFQKKPWYQKVWPTIKHWFLPAMVILALVLGSLFYYCMLGFMFQPDTMGALFNVLDAIVLGPYGVKALVMWIVGALTQNMAWVGPYSLTFLVAGTFSFLLVCMPRFLDSKIGFLLYLPALHFIGQLLFMWSTMYLGTYSLVATVPPAVLIGLLGAFHILTLVGLVFRGFFKKYNHPLVKRLVPWVDEYRDLVADY